MGKKQEKTNAMRIMDRAKVEYEIHDYTHTSAIAGGDVASVLGEDPSQVFKTLVTVGKSGQYYVFLVPVCCELNLKKAASAVNEKNIEMIKANDLLPLTGYIHGGCSPVGMKKAFPTVIDVTAKGFEKIFFSAGKIGLQAEIKLCDVEKVIKYTLADIT